MTIAVVAVEQGLKARLAPSAAMAARAAIGSGGVAGLGESMSFDKDGQIAGGLGAGNCVYVPRSKGGAFVVEPGFDPVCGTIVPGVEVDP
ncbi:hypothetical protein [Nocardia arizonensis]|uniref:hypothetical protein n=1 Tax=Nocardia arizonensis TaxID=1141647 RepID=UPI0006D14F5D|nr:hypothetical protein [Nocardia arizonensis]